MLSRVSSCGLSVLSEMIIMSSDIELYVMLVSWSFDVFLLSEDRLLMMLIQSRRPHMVVLTLTACGCGGGGGCNYISSTLGGQFLFEHTADPLRLIVPVNMTLVSDAFIVTDRVVLWFLTPWNARRDLVTKLSAANYPGSNHAVCVCQYSVSTSTKQKTN